MSKKGIKYHFLLEYRAKQNFDFRITKHYFLIDTHSWDATKGFSVSFHSLPASLFLLFHVLIWFLGLAFVGGYFFLFKEERKQINIAREPRGFHQCTKGDI